jgi:hypothetical protein
VVPWSRTPASGTTELADDKRATATAHNEAVPDYTKGSSSDEVVAEGKQGVVLIS